MTNLLACWTPARRMLLTLAVIGSAIIGLAAEGHSAAATRPSRIQLPDKLEVFGPSHKRASFSPAQRKELTELLGQYRVWTRADAPDIPPGAEICRAPVEWEITSRGSSSAPRRALPIQVDLHGDVWRDASLLTADDAVRTRLVGLLKDVLADGRGKQRPSTTAPATAENQKDLIVTVRSATAVVDRQGWSSLKAELVLQAVDKDVSTQPFWTAAYDIVSNSPGVSVFPVAITTMPDPSSREMQQLVVSKDPVKIEIELSPSKTRLLMDHGKVGRTIELRLRYNWQDKRSQWTTCRANVAWQGQQTGQ